MWGARTSRARRLTQTAQDPRKGPRSLEGEADLGQGPDPPVRDERDMWVAARGDPLVGAVYVGGKPPAAAEETDGKVRRDERLRDGSCLRSMSPS